MALTPVMSEDILSVAEEASNPTFSWRVNVDGEDGMIGSINGYVEEVEAIMQQIYLLLNTERWRYKIFLKSGYGVEKEDLIGAPLPYVIPEIDRRYTEVILNNIPEVTGVGRFSFEIPENKKGVLLVSFMVKTIYGSYDVTNETEIK